MDKAQGIHEFWSAFGLDAFDENTVPADAALPRITYEVATSDLDRPISLSASLWYRSTSWREISQKADDIAEFIGEGQLISIDEGYLWVVRGQPFAQRMADSDDSIRRIYLMIDVEFISLK